jgi:hypothetical protein
MTMSDELTQTGVKFDASLWQRFRENVKARKGGIDGHLRTELENALREYLDASDGGDMHDRFDRVDDRLDTLLALVEDERKKKKEESVSSRTENRLDKIRQQINEETNNSPKVHKEVVELAIRDNAGGSDPTIRRYKKLLRQDKELFPHPDNDRMYFTDAEDFVMATNALRKGGKLDAEQYSEVVNRYGEDWWLAQQEDDDGSVAFQ